MRNTIIFLFIVTCICSWSLLYFIPVKQIIDKSIIGVHMPQSHAPKVEIYTKSYCPHCVRAKELLKKKGITFAEIDIENDSELAAKIMERAGGAKTVPQIFINGVHVGGCDDLYALDREGKLDEMLK